MSDLHYTLRFRDYWLFHCISQFTSPITQSMLLLCGGAFGHWAWDQGAGGAAAIAAVAGYAAFWVLQCAFNALYLKSRNNRALLTAHTIRVSTEGLRDSTEAYDNLVRWRGVARVANYGIVVAVYTSAVDAVVLPRAAFGSASGQLQWLNAVRAASASAL